MFLETEFFISCPETHYEDQVGTELRISTPLNPGCWENDFKNNNQKERKTEISQPGI